MSDPAADFLAEQEANMADIVSDDAQPQQELADDMDELSLDAATVDESATDAYAAITQADKFATEPEKIRIWRETQAKRLEEKDAAEQAELEELKAQGEKELEDWFKHYRESIEKSKRSNREAEEEYVKHRDTTNSGVEWERVAQLVDFSAKTSKATKDTARMRSALLSLKTKGKCTPAAATNGGNE